MCDTYINLTNSDIPEFLKESKFYKESGLFDKSTNDDESDTEVKIEKRHYINTNKPKTFNELIRVLEMYRFWMIDNVTSLYDYFIKTNPKITINNKALDKSFCKDNYQLPFEIKLIINVTDFCNYRITDNVSYLEKIEFINNAGLSRHSVEYFYNTLLCASVYEGFVDLTKHLIMLRRRSGIYFENFKLYEIAFTRNHINIATCLLSEKIITEDGYPLNVLLQLACKHKQFEFVKLLHQKYEKKLKRQINMYHTYHTYHTYQSSVRKVVNSDEQIQIFKYLFDLGYAIFNTNNEINYNANFIKQEKIIEFLFKDRQQIPHPTLLRLLIREDKYDTFKIIVDSLKNKEIFKKVTHEIMGELIKSNKIEFLKLCIYIIVDYKYNQYDYAMTACTFGAFKCFKYLIENNYPTNLTHCLQEVTSRSVYNNHLGYKQIIDYIESGVPKNYNYKRNMTYNFIGKCVLGAVFGFCAWIILKDADIKGNINNTVNKTVKYLENPKNRKELVRAGNKILKAGQTKQTKRYMIT